MRTATLGMAHSGSQIAGPGQGPYEWAVEFYDKGASDPKWVRQYLDGVGGQVS